MTIHTVTISGVTPNPEVYGGLPAAANYIGAMFSTSATAWAALSASDQGRTLRAATLFLDRQPWDGAATGLSGVDVTTLQWPRSDVTVNGEAVDSTTVPADIVAAAFEMAVLISADQDIITALDQGTNVSSVSAGGGVSVSFFHPTSAALGTASRLPLVVQQLVSKYLAVPDGPNEGGTGVYGNCTSAYAAAAQFGLVEAE